jgi:hypothetical protein
MTICPSAETTKPEQEKKMSEDFNMSMRKFLKQVGVTSQQAIKEAFRDTQGTEGKEFNARVVLTVDGVDLEHVVTGKIKG